MHQFLHTLRHHSLCSLYPWHFLGTRVTDLSTQSCMCVTGQVKRKVSCDCMVSIATEWLLQLILYLKRRKPWGAVWSELRLNDGPRRWLSFLKGSLLFTLKTLQIYKQVNIKCTLANIHTHLLLWRCRLTATWPWPCGRVLFGVSMFSSLFLPVYVYVCVCVVIGCWPAPPVPPASHKMHDGMGSSSPVTPKRISSVDIGRMDEYLLMHNYICYVSACQKVNNAFWSYGDQMPFHRKDGLAPRCSAFRLCYNKDTSTT